MDLWIEGCSGRRVDPASNCDQLDVYLDGRSIGSFHPDHTSCPNLLYPPSLLALSWDEAASATLWLDGFVQGKVVIPGTMAGSRKGYRLWIKADDPVIMANGADSTRIFWVSATASAAAVRPPRASYRFNSPVPPTLVGDTSFDLSETGAVGAVWVRSLPGHAGMARTTIRHADYEERSVQITTAHSETRAELSRG